ncbi:hypothetical protein ACIRP7_19545 [Streptomyces sp. NPDC102270]|uniref:hypothetical protein n=1 Tax=Streptomyces sp. NPDC102270 TaxID=3366150 RepID=UPI00382639DC
MYDGTALHMSTAGAPDTVIARADTCGFTTEPWDMTAYRASIHQHGGVAAHPQR